MRKTSVIAAWFTTIMTVGFSAIADTTFTYQGELKENGGLANGAFNMDFSLWDAVSAGNQISATIILNGVPVTDGKFTVELDFGAAAFDNSNRWLEISVNTTTLSPRNPVSRAPYSIQTRGIFVDENENVGIGTTAPSYPLHVESSAASPIYGLYTGNGGSRYGVYGRTDSGAATRGVFGYASSPNGITLGVQGRSDSVTGTGVEGYAFASSGLNYGIRGVTNSPDGYAGYFLGRAHVSDTLFVGRENRITSAEYFGFNAPVNSGFGGMYISTDGDAGMPFYGYSAGGDVDAYHYYDGTTGSWHLNNGGNRLTVQSNGNVGIGTITPVNTLHVVSTGQVAILGDNTGTSGLRVGVFGETDGVFGSQGVRGVASATTGLSFGVWGRSNSSLGYDFYADGAGTDYGSSSSRRWKNNIANIDRPLDKIARLRGVYFDWDKEHGGHHDVGMIAEEVGEILPEIVQYEENGIDAIGMDYSKMTPLLVEAVNALRKENEELRERLHTLERTIEQLAPPSDQ